MQKSATKPYTNNFDFLRLLFSTFVLVTHSYALTGLPEHDYLWHFSHGQIHFARFGVIAFFAISGYLILLSLLRSRSLWDYYFKRIIRVFPALWVVTGLTLLIAYFISGKTVSAYLADSSVHRYLFNLILRIQYSIDGVFEHNPFPSAINGSLWTVPYEFFYYLALTPLFFLRNRKKALRIGLITAFAALLALEYTGHTHFLTYRLNLESEKLIVFGLCFSGGAILALFPEWMLNPQRRKVLVVASGLGIAATMLLGGFEPLKYFLVPVFVIALGNSSYPLFTWVRRYGDISYGIYILGFPLQQFLWYFLQPSQPVMLLLSIPITWVLGYASWHLIEKQALRLKLNLPQRERGKQVLDMAVASRSLVS
jgi:peptidoglycan/LPS O-acetylase OafA/YrhL